MNKIHPPNVKELSRVSKEEWREFTRTVWSVANTTDKEHPAVFPEELPRRLIKLFSFHGETVADPFGGTGTTARVALELGRRAVCVEQNPKFAKRIQTDCKAILNGNYKPELLNVIQGDCRSVGQLADNSVSLIITSPPYWDKADYGSKPSNIGRNQAYHTFLDEMAAAFSEFYRILEPGRKCCIITANVNQYTDQGLLTFPLASDFNLLLRQTGFVMVNEIIWSKEKTGGKWGSANGQRPIFGSYPYPPNFLFKNVHEYILIFAKPSTILKQSPKAKPYRELMGIGRSASCVD